MSEDKFLTIIDYGSSKIRLCVYDKSLPNQKYILDKTCNNDFSSIKTNLNDSEKILQELIHKTEKKINNHVNDAILMLDSSSIFSIDLYTGEFQTFPGSYWLHVYTKNID